MLNILRRLWPRRIYAQPLLTAPAHPYALLTPISLSERKPGNSDYCDDLIWWGYRYFDTWLWDLRLHPEDCHTHWLPASVEVLPARCCPPEVGT